MSAIRTSNASGLDLLIRLHADYVLALLTVGGALLAGAWLGTPGLP